MRLLLTPFLLMLLVVAAVAEDFEARVHKQPDGVELPYRLLKPLNYDKATKYPLVVFLHGSGERGSDNAKQIGYIAGLTTNKELREKFPCFVIAPQCPDEKKWVEMPWDGITGDAPKETSPVQQSLLGALDSLAKEFSLDPDRLYITGLSMGGYGTWDLITRFPDKWAAAIPICGGGDKARAGLAKPVPVWAFHGADDTVVLPVRTQDMVDGLRAAGGRASYTLYPAVSHDAWIQAYSEPNLLPWLFAQKRGQGAKLALAYSEKTIPMPDEKYFTGQGPITISDWFKGHWIECRQRFTKTPDNEQGAVVFLGDSITEGWQTLAKDFPRFKTANRGIAGDTSRGVLFRMDEVLNLKPKAVSLLIGTNDLGLGGEPEQIAANIKEIVALLQKQNPKMPIVINRVMPRGKVPGLFPDKIQKLNGLIDELVKSNKRLTLCDTWSIFDNGSGECKVEEFPDMLHLNPAAYAKWQNALDAVFKKLNL